MLLLTNNRTHPYCRRRGVPRRKTRYGKSCFHQKTEVQVMTSLSEIHRTIYRQWHYGEWRWRRFLNKDSTLLQRRKPLSVQKGPLAEALRDLRRDGITSFP